MSGPTGIRRDQTCDWIHEICGWVDLEVLNTYEKYLIQDTGCNCRHDRAKNGVRKAKDLNLKLWKT